ncbi:LexA family transcriptional regulator [uncultured Helicobacter sp.]|uniref:XRE family transcriptional regulator n=1 Tax=uncultured Helicobacter sp. TaxID=175537 RepID=UPI00261B1763|nr:LexA family transcriptional regulator [uncultured Helicobacter sp.]
MLVGDRIREARIAKSLTRKDLGDMMSVAEKTIYNYETNKQAVTLDFLEKLSDILGLDYEYFVHKSKSISLNDGVHKLSISPKPTAQINTDIVQIPIYDDVVASAGGGVINDEYPTQSVGIDKGFLRTHFGLSSFLGLSIITAKGDSMSPTIPENCQLLVQKSVPKEGQICVVRIDDELYVKRLQKLPKYRLISDNKSYENIELEGREYDIVGVVVGFFKRMI